MIIKIFKIPTKEMYVLKHKKQLLDFIAQETGCYLLNSFTIDHMFKFLPQDVYYRMK